MIEQMTKYLEREHVGFELLPHPRSESAQEEAHVLGIPADEVAKTVVVVTDRGYVRAVIPASAHLDLEKLNTLLGLAHDARLATEDELAVAYPSFELGAVPPFGGPGGDRTVVDRRLAELDSVVVEAGTHSESLRIKTTDMLVHTIAEIGDICHD